MPANDTWERLGESNQHHKSCGFTYHDHFGLILSGNWPGARKNEATKDGKSFQQVNLHYLIFAVTRESHEYQILDERRW